MGEIWKDVVGFENYYQVSSMGRIKSLDRKIQTKNSVRAYKGRLLKLSPNTDGYLVVRGITWKWEINV